jgi:hypothetical protein
MRQPADLRKGLMRTYHWISLFMSYKVSKLAYRIWVILIANRKSYKKIHAVHIRNQIRYWVKLVALSLEFSVSDLVQVKAECKPIPTDSKGTETSRFPHFLGNRFRWRWGWHLYTRVTFQVQKYSWYSFLLWVLLYYWIFVLLSVNVTHSLLIFYYSSTCFGLTRPSSGVIEYSPPEVLALLCQFSPMWCCQPCASPDVVLIVSVRLLE